MTMTRRMTRPWILIYRLRCRFFSILFKLMPVVITRWWDSNWWQERWRWHVLGNLIYRPRCGSCSATFLSLFSTETEVWHSTLRFSGQNKSGWKCSSSIQEKDLHSALQFLCRKIWVKFVFLQRDGSLALNVAVVLLSKVYSTHDEQGHIVSRLELNSDSLVELN